MSIKRGIRPMLAEVGKIKTGCLGETRKSKTGKDFRLPVKLNWFVVVKTHRDKDGNFVVDPVNKKLGERTKEINIRLPFDDIDLNFFCQFQYYNGKKCLCKGDGETAVQKTDKGDKQIDCDPDTCPRLLQGKCQVSGSLSCFISESMQIGGVYKYRTHSWYSVSSILGSLNYISKNTNGVLMGIPLKLVMLRKETAEHGHINYVTVLVDGDEMKAIRDAAIAERESRKMLGVDIKQIEAAAVDSGFFADTDDPGEIQEEFYPPTMELTEDEAKKYNDSPVAERVLAKMNPEVIVGNQDKEPELFEN